LRTLNRGVDAARTMHRQATASANDRRTAMPEILNAGEICNRIVVVAERDTPLLEAAKRMREQHVGCLVVVDETGAGRLVVGMLTDRDIVTAVIARAVEPDVLRVEDMMTTDVVTVAESTPFAELLATMRRKGLRRLPVTDAKGGLVGLVTLDDLLEIVAEQMRTLVQAIETEQRRERNTRR
jgi:CBS domain-containing protein